MTFSSIEVIAFDFDGIILESVAVKEQAILDLFQDTSMEERKRVLNLHRQSPGINRRNRITLLMRQALGRKVSENVVDAMLDRFARLVWNGLMSCSEVPGIRNFLKLVIDVPCYVVSASPQEELRAVAEHRNFSRYFVEMYGTPPAKRDLLNNIISRESIQAKSLLFIGDKITDYKAAQEVGARFIGRQSLERVTDFPDCVPVIRDFASKDIKNLLM